MKYWQKLLFISLSLLATSAQAMQPLPINEDKTPYQTETIWPDITIPWGMVQLPNGKMLATERSGKLWLLTEGKPSIEITGLPEIHDNGQGGLLDIALHPEFCKKSAYLFHLCE